MQETTSEHLISSQFWWQNFSLDFEEKKFLNKNGTQEKPPHGPPTKPCWKNTKASRTWVQDKAGEPIFSAVGSPGVEVLTCDGSQQSAQAWG